MPKASANEETRAVWGSLIQIATEIDYQPFWSFPFAASPVEC